MKNYLTIIATAFLFVACTGKQKEVTTTPEVVYSKFGKEITPKKAISKAEMLEMYKTMKEGDTVKVKFQSEILEDHGFG